MTAENSADQTEAPEPIPSRTEIREEWIKCPLYETDDKFAEAGFFLRRMMESYHEPDEFRWHLNGFLQALRSVTFFLQKQLADKPGFVEWYEPLQDTMRQDTLLRRFVEGRNIVVKQRNLYVTSTAKIGLFRYRELRLGMSLEVPAHVPSAWILANQAPKLNFVIADHGPIGEEYGVQRAWVVAELGEGNVVDLCNSAWHRIGAVLEEAHRFLGVHQPGPNLPIFASAECDILTETDVDPTLPTKWGWDGG